ncbi:hypothetical protein FSARC_874 [Fusarium sarcochroum]|uniref:2,5-diamino-6-ribosylamino-4(3H)-pyrimidinone 5'-phosphate reductase n=1 Tax=Fusarium sarcochroum TaxID=1208366 RepID=A0A8H4XFS6_9HYPO|nr:hypothetical protein FSARC_874 [Fusarium sarcochroum]
MPHLRYNVATSLDGYIASLDGSTRWIVDDSTIDFDALYAEFDFFVMGRKTYEVMQSYGGPDENPLAKRSKESVIVASRSMKQEDFPSITVVSDNVIDYIWNLKSGAEKDIWLMGGGLLASQCLEACLVDTIEAAIIPVVLGDGIKVVEQVSRNFGLCLSASKALESGVVMTQYTVINGQAD